MIVRHIEGVGENEWWEIVDGHCVFDGLKHLGYKTALCVDMGKMEDLDAELLYFELNFNIMVIDYDHEKASRMVKRLVDAFGADTLASRCRLDLAAVDSYYKLADFDWKKFKNDEGGGSQRTVFEALEPGGDR